MSFIKTRDQSGNPIPFMNVRIAEGHKSSDEAYDDKFSDDGGNLSFVMHLAGPHSLYANYRSVDMERFILEKYGHNEGPRWKTASTYVQDLDAAEITLVLDRADAPPPSTQLTTIHCPSDGSFSGYGTTQEWKPIAHKLAPGGIMEPDEQHGGTGSQPNLEAFDLALRAIPVPSGFSPCQLQFSSNGDKKPRIHLPVKPQVNVEDCGMYSRPVDIGDFGFKFFCNATSTDEWQLTGRPSGSQW